MNIEKLKSKIHRASVTCANLNYVGSLSLDENQKLPPLPVVPRQPPGREKRPRNRGTDLR